MIVVKTVEAKFTRSGIKTKKTILWKEIQDDLKDEIENKIRFLESEECIICFMESKKNILLLTTNRVIILGNRVNTVIPYTSIKKVDINEIFEDKKNKKKVDSINLILKSDETVTLKIEIGTWPVMLSIIKFLVRSV